MDTVGSLPPRRRSFLAQPCLVLGGVAVVGSMAPGALCAAGLVALAWVALGAALGPDATSRWVCWGALVLGAGSALRASTAVQDFETRRTSARDALGVPQRCAATVSVASSPSVRTSWPALSTATTVSCAHADGSSLELDGPERAALWRAHTTALSCEKAELRGEFWLSISGGPEDLARGDRVEVVLGLAPTQLFRNAGVPDPTPAAARRRAVLSGAALSADVVQRASGPLAWIDRARAAVRRRIEATYPPLVVPLGRALVLGESDLPDDDARAFSQSGLMHLLAVSGTHLVIAVLALVRGSRELLVRLQPVSRRYDVARLASAFGAVLSLIYADFAGGSGSAFRAAYMLCAVLGARALGFRLGGAAALGVSLLVGVALDPLVAADLSFLLSALATAGLIGLGQPLTRLVSRGPFAHGLLGKLVESLAATFSSSVACGPALALLDGQMTAAALAANVVAGPFGELLALPACLLHAVSSPFPSIERGLALVGGGALHAVRGLALWSASLESARFRVALPSPFDVATCMLSAFVLAWWTGQMHSHGRRIRPSVHGLVALVVTVLGLVGGALQTARWLRGPRSVLAVTALDVGQGDALALEFPDGRLALVDGGGFPGGVPDTGARVLAPFLRSRGRKDLDLVVLSHAHPDHLLGLATLADSVPIRELWHPAGAAAMTGPYARLVQAVRKSGGRVLGPVELCGRRRDMAGVNLDVLEPCPGPEDLGPNDDSLVVRVGFGRRHVLLTGDIEGPGEARLLESGAELSADLLKAPHHGSHTSSSPELVRRVAPIWAVIQSGVRNRFDHPRRVTLERLRQLDVGVLRTDRSGSITFRTDGNRAQLFAFSPPR